MDGAHPPVTTEKDVRYILVVRNPEEALVSAKPFLEKHTDEWLEFWQVPKTALTRPDFPAFYREVLEPGAMVRRGQIGSASEDGMTPEISAHLRAKGSQICSDDRVLRWLYEGGHSL